MMLILAILALFAIFVYPMFALFALGGLLFICFSIVFVAAIGIQLSVAIVGFLAYFAAITACVMSEKFNFLQLAHKLILIASMPCLFIVFCVIFTGGFGLPCFVITVPIVIFSSVVCAYVINKDKNNDSDNWKG